jgi:hypothetical protein
LKSLPTKKQQQRNVYRYRVLPLYCTGLQDNEAEHFAAAVGAQAEEQVPQQLEVALLEGRLL